MIPTETFEEIARHLDTKDLLNICYVSRFYRDQANRIIYRSVFVGRVGIPGHEYTRIKRFISTIRSSPLLALYVQELKFVAPPTAQLLENTRPSSVFGLPKWRPAGKRCLFSTLINLRKLSIETFEYSLPWPKYLNSFPAGKLEELSTYFAVTPSFLEFLAHHPTIQRIHFPFLASANVSVGSSIPYNIVKSITHLTGDTRILPLASTWTNLTHLGLAILSSSLPESTLSALDIIGPGLTNLSIWANGGPTLFGSDSPSFLLPQIARKTPNVRVFALKACASIIVQFEFEKLGLDRTSHWLNLDTLIIINIMYPHLDINPAFTTFPSLNRLIAVYGEHSQTLFTCYQKFPVTGEIEKEEGLSPSVLKELLFGFVEREEVGFISRN